MDEGYPTFEKAVTQFGEFLSAQKWPPQVFWIRPGDARFWRGRVVIRPVPAAIGEVYAREVYSKAVSARLGVRLEAVCRVGERTFARVVRPLDEDASSRGLFPAGLKLAARESPLSAKIGSGWMWPLFATATSWPFNDLDIEA